MTPEEAIESIVSRCTITKNRPNPKNSTMFAVESSCIDVTEEEYKAVYIGDRLYFNHSEIGNLTATIARKSDSREWKSLHEYEKKFRVEVQFYPQID